MLFSWTWEPIATVGSFAPFLSVLLRCRSLCRLHITLAKSHLLHSPQPGQNSMPTVHLAQEQTWTSFPRVLTIPHLTDLSACKKISHFLCKLVSHPAYIFPSKPWAQLESRAAGWPVDSHPSDHVESRGNITLLGDEGLSSSTGHRLHS